MASEIIGKVMITEEEIEKRAAEIGEQITKEFAGEEIAVVGILRGAFVWMAELIKHIDLPLRVDFMSVSSYGASTKTSGIVRIVKDLDLNIEGKNVIIVEDIIDSGVTLTYLRGYFQDRKPKTLRICTLLDKPEGRRVEIAGDYVGFKVGDQFIIGYGLDFDQKYRNLPYISYLEGADKEMIMSK